MKVSLILHSTCISIATADHYPSSSDLQLQMILNLQSGLSFLLDIQICSSDSTITRPSVKLGFNHIFDEFTGTSYFELEDTFMLGSQY